MVNYAPNLLNFRTFIWYFLTTQLWKTPQQRLRRKQLSSHDHNTNTTSESLTWKEKKRRWEPKKRKGGRISVSEKKRKYRMDESPASVCEWASWSLQQTPGENGRAGNLPPFTKQKKQKGKREREGEGQKEEGKKSCEQEAWAGEDCPRCFLNLRQLWGASFKQIQHPARSDVRHKLSDTTRTKTKRILKPRNLQSDFLFPGRTEKTWVVVEVEVEGSRGF